MFLYLLGRAPEPYLSFLVVLYNRIAFRILIRGFAGTPDGVLQQAINVGRETDHGGVPHTRPPKLKRGAFFGQWVFG